LDNPIDIIVTTLSSPSGSGRCNFDAKNYFGSNESQRIRVLNDDNLCIFYALELARIWHDKTIISELKKEGKDVPNNLTSQRAFSRLRYNKERQRQYALGLLEELDIQNNLEAYGITHLEVVQTYYDKKYPGLYRIILIDDTPETKPLWVGPMGRKFDVSLYLENGHYDALKSISCFFGHRKYCPGIIIL
jgi:hypothetical protein